MLCSLHVYMLVCASGLSSSALGRAGRVLVKSVVLVPSNWGRQAQPPTLPFPYLISLCQLHNVCVPLAVLPLPPHHPLALNAYANVFSPPGWLIACLADELTHRRAHH